MESFKVWIMSLCGATAVAALFKILLSGSSLKKVINVFFSIFILFYTVIPIQNFFQEKFEISSTDTEFSYNEYYEAGYQSLMKQSIINVCEKIGVDVLNVDIDSYIDEEGYVNVNSIIVETNSSNKKDIENEIKNKLGFEVTVN